MATEWYFAEDGVAVGPLSVEEILRRIDAASDEPPWVWSEGGAGWRDARETPPFAQALAHSPARTASTLAQRARHEAIAYLAICAYLFTWFSALLFYKASILRDLGVEFAPFGLALVKALILGKFILVLEALKVGEGQGKDSLLVLAILKKALLFTLFLALLSIGEELIVGFAHGRSMTESLHAVGGGTLAQTVAVSVLMFMVLLPYLAFRRLALTFGDLPEQLFARRAPASAQKDASDEA
jgi:hypothetical protein